MENGIPFMPSEILICLFPELLLSPCRGALVLLLWVLWKRDGFL